MTAPAGRSYETWVPPAPISASRCREFVREVLASHRTLDAWSDTAQLLVSELVTNSIMHAQTIVGVVVTVYDGGLRVSISDSGPAEITPRPASETSTTGRGLDLVRLLAGELGFVTRPAGKEVWFSLGVVPRMLAGEAYRGPAATSASLTLQSVPWLLFLSWVPHAAAMVRETLLISLSAPAGGGQVPLEDLAAANEAIGYLAVAAAAADLPLEGTTRTDLSMQLSPRLTDSFVQLKRVLRVAFELAVNGSLLVRPAPPEVVALREWLCDEVARQSAGGPPTSWPATDLTTNWLEQMPPAQFDVIQVTTSEEAVVAADDTNRILAVSSSAAALLGWEAERLVGQRITVLVPARLREAHVAGFVHFLLTGKRALTEHPIVLPALRADGSEVSIRLFIDPLGTDAGRTVFLAHFEPVT